jgi:hypothetical protein
MSMINELTGRVLKAYNLPQIRPFTHLSRAVFLDRLRMLTHLHKNALLPTNKHHLIWLEHDITGDRGFLISRYRLVC